MDKLNTTYEQLLTSITGRQGPWQQVRQLAETQTTIDFALHTTSFDVRGQYDKASRLLNYVAVIGQGLDWHAAASRAVQQSLTQDYDVDYNATNLCNELKLRLGGSLDSTTIVFQGFQYAVSYNNAYMAASLIISPPGSVVPDMVPVQPIQSDADVATATATTLSQVDYEILESKRLKIRMALHNGKHIWTQCEQLERKPHERRTKKEGCCAVWFGGCRMRKFAERCHV